MYNRYRGSGGRPQRMDPPQSAPRPASPLPPQQGAAAQPRPPGSGQRPPTPGRKASGDPGAPPGEPSGKKKPPGDGRKGLEYILSRLDPGKLETEDLLVLAILWLLYRDSGDKELLIAMGAYLFL